VTMLRRHGSMIHTASANHERADDLASVNPRTLRRYDSVSPEPQYEVLPWLN
jgi:hypothetical protein